MSPTINRLARNPFVGGGAALAGWLWFGYVGALVGFIAGFALIGLSPVFEGLAAHRRSKVIAVETREWQCGTCKEYFTGWEYSRHLDETNHMFGIRGRFVVPVSPDFVALFERNAERRRRAEATEMAHQSSEFVRCPWCKVGCGRCDFTLEVPECKFCLCPLLWDGRRWVCTSSAPHHV